MRVLSQMEQAWTLTDQAFPLSAVSILNLHPGPPPEVMRLALSRLQTLVPALRVSIRKEKSGFRFVECTSCPPIPLEVIDRRDEHHWKEVARDRLNRSIPIHQAPLMAGVYLWSASGQTDLILAFHHALGDAASFSSWIHQLLRYCVDPDDQAVAEAFHFLPGSEDLFPWDFRGSRKFFHLPAFLFRQMRSEWTLQRANRRLLRPPIPGKAENAIGQLAFDEPTTQALIRQSRKREVSIAGLLSAAMLLALRETRYEGKAGAFRSIVFTELRPFLRPPVAPQRPGCYLAMFRLTEYLPRGEALWGLAHRLSLQIYRAGKRGERYLFAYLSKALVNLSLKMRNQRLGHTALSYVGPVPIQSQYGEFRIQNIHGYITNNPFGAEYTAFGKIWAHQLELDIQYLVEEYSPEEAKKIAQKVRQLLEEAAASSPTL